MPEQSGSPMPAHAVPTLVPADEHNRTLLHNVHPPDWRNPEPAPRYNLVVIGAGTAGLVTAAGAAGLGARVALVERYLLGGDCLNVGCVPSKCAVITTGARPSPPPIPGLAEAGFLTNESVFSLTGRPAALAVIGAGPIGCELAQAFRRLGSEVVLFDAAPHVLVREDADAAEILQRAFVRDGVRLVLSCELRRVTRRGPRRVIELAAG